MNAANATGKWNFNFLSKPEASEKPSLRCNFPEEKKINYFNDLIKLIFLNVEHVFLFFILFLENKKNNCIGIGYIRKVWNNKCQNL